MALEIGVAIAAVAVLGLATPIARRAVVRHAPHARLAILAFCVAYATLIAIFVVDVTTQQPLPPAFRFARGFAAGIAAGLLGSSGALWVYDFVTCGDTRRRDPSST